MRRSSGSCETLADDRIGPRTSRQVGEDIERMYGDDLVQWRKIRDEVDPESMFVGTWHREHVMAGGGKCL